MKRLFKYAWNYKKHLLVAAFFAFLGSFIVLWGPRLIGDAVDYILGKDQVNFTVIAGKILILSAIYIVGAIFSWIVPILAATISSKMVSDMRKDAFDNINKLPMSFFDTNKRGDVISSLTNDIDNISEGVSQVFTQLFSGLISILGSLAFMFVISPVISLVVIGITPISILIARFVTSRSSKMFAQQQKNVGILNGYTEEVISNERLIMSYGLAGTCERKFEDINKNLYKVAQKAAFYGALVNPTTRFINHLSYVSVGIIGGYLAVSKELSVGSIVSLLTYSTSFARPINEISSVTNQIQVALASAKRVFRLIDEQTESVEAEDVASLEVVSGDVKFENVSFSYNPEKPLIRNFTFHAKPNSVVAIVGQTGAGKTTLVNLLMRFYDTDSGKIFIDDTDISTVSRDSVRTSFAMVLQDTWLFGGTIRDNIAYGKPDATLDEIIEAAKHAHANNFIVNLPKGYDTVISGDGGDLSYGEQQLITIARAMLMDPKLLILDEATSSVDLRTEQRISKAFLEMMKGRTSFVIAHRLSTIKNSDLILVMKDGNVVEEGNHETLMNLQGEYFTLYNSKQKIEDNNEL